MGVAGQGLHGAFGAGGGGRPWTSRQLISGPTHKNKQPFILKGSFEPLAHLSQIMHVFGVWEDTGLRCGEGTVPPPFIQNIENTFWLFLFILMSVSD